MKETRVIKVFEAFAGMGAQRKALTNIEANYKIVGLAEWFVPAILTYEAIHSGIEIDVNKSSDEMIAFLESKTLSMNSKTPVRKGYWKRYNKSKLPIIYTAVKQSENNGNIFDVQTLYLRKLKGIDLLTYSFPCQDLSQQGKQLGMKKNSGTRSGLLWEIEKSLSLTPKKDRPSFLLMENVVSLTFKRHKEDLEEWKKALDSLGYNNDIRILNSAKFGSPQARRRVFMISTLKTREKVELPIGDEEEGIINQILNTEHEQEDIMPALSLMELTEEKLTRSNIMKSRLPLSYTTFNSEAFVYNKMFTGPTLTASGANSRIKIRQDGEIRKINAIEAYRYMGFDDDDYNNVNKFNILTKNKMIYTCGNSISVQVLMAIFKEVLNGF